MTKADLITHLLDLAAALDRTPGECICSCTVGIHTPGGDTPDQARQRLALVARALGTVEKRVMGDTFWLSQESDNYEWTVTAFADRGAVCQRIVVGTKEIPASEEYTVPATPARTEEIIEWQCDQPILQSGGAV